MTEEKKSFLKTYFQPILISSLISLLSVAGLIRMNAQWAFSKLGGATQVDVTELWSENSQLRAKIAADSVRFEERFRKLESSRDSLSLRSAQTEKNQEMTAAIMALQSKDFSQVEKATISSDMSWQHSLATESLLKKLYVNASVAYSTSTQYDKPKAGHK